MSEVPAQFTLDYQCDPGPHARERCEAALDLTSLTSSWPTLSPFPLQSRSQNARRVSHDHTVRPMFHIALSPSQLEAWDRRITTKATGQISEQHTLNVKVAPDEVPVRCTYFPHDYKSNPMLTIEACLPKPAFGNDYTIIHDLQAAALRANEILATIKGLPALDILQGQLLRSDPCYNHQVGSLVPDYVNAIGHLEYPHRRIKHHRSEGAEFRSKHTTTKFYNKYRETGDPAAQGILRQEITMLKGKLIAQRMGLTHPKLADVTPEWLAWILLEDLVRLQLIKRTIHTRDTALEALCIAHCPDAGICLWGLLQARYNTSTRQLRSSTRLHPSSLGRRLGKIAEAGIALTLTNSGEPLPPLRIDL